MTDEQNKANNQISNQPKSDEDKSPYELYMEEKTEREKLQEQLSDKDTKYQKDLINLNKSISELKGSLLKKDKEIEITKTKYWSDKESNYEEAVSRRQNSEEGIVVSSIYDYLDRRAEEGKHLKKINIHHL